MAFEKLKTGLKLKVYYLFTFLCVMQTIPTQVESANAYFILNSECSSLYTCTGDTHDISIICQNSKCICDPRFGIYDIDRYQCVGKSNNACLGDLCTRNSLCDATSKTCKCSSSYEVSDDGRCVHKYSESCDENEDCANGFSCYDGQCECRFPSHQYYDTNNKTCYSVAHSWDSHFQNSISRRNHSESNYQTHSTSVAATCFEILVSMMEILFLVAVAVMLWKIWQTLKEINGSFKIHGYFMQSDLKSQTQNCDPSMQFNATLIDP